MRATPQPSRHALAVLCALALATAGCGEDDKFVDEYNRATKPLEALQQPGKGTAREYDRLADITSGVNDDLAKLEAPDDARAAFDRLRDELTGSEATLRDLARAARTEDTGAARRAADQLIQDGRAVERAEEAVAAKVE